jgi:hypothetical protein
MIVDSFFQCSGCGKPCRITFEAAHGGARAAIVRHSCAAEMAIVSADRPVTFYEMGNDNKYCFSESLTVHNL